MRTSKPRSLGSLAGVVRHAGRIAALLILDNLAADPLAPDGQLLDGRGAERVAGGDKDFLALLLESPSQLGDGRGFARTVDAGHHHHCRPVRIKMDVLASREHVFQLLLDERFHVAADFFIEKRLADLLDDFAGGAGADIGEIEAFLQFAQEIAVHLAAKAK